MRGRDGGIGSAVRALVETCAHEKVGIAWDTDSAVVAPLPYLGQLHSHGADPHLPHPGWWRFFNL